MLVSGFDAQSVGVNRHCRVVLVNQYRHMGLPLGVLVEQNVHSHGAEHGVEGLDGRLLDLLSSHIAAPHQFLAEKSPRLFLCSHLGWVDPAQSVQTQAIANPGSDDFAAHVENPPVVRADVHPGRD